MPPGIHQILLGLSHCHNNCPSYFSVLTKAREKGSGFALQAQVATMVRKPWLLTLHPPSSRKQRMLILCLLSPFYIVRAPSQGMVGLLVLRDPL